MPPATTTAPGPDLGEVSILIVNWNAGPLLLRCVKAALATTAEVVVVDNASRDGSADAVAAGLPAARVLRQRTNLGFAGGVNAAARAAHGRVLLVLNPDTRPSGEAIARLRETLRDTGAGIVGACLEDESGIPQAGFNVRRFPTLWTWAADLLLLDNLWPGNPARRRYLAADVPITGPSPLDVDQPAGACLMIGRDEFDRLGGFDEAFFPAWFEDVDFCRRARAAGLRVVYEPRARITHAGGVSVPALGRAGFERAWYRNMRRYARKHHGRLANSTLTALLLAGMSLRILACLVNGDREGRRAFTLVLRDTLGPVDGTDVPGPSHHRPR